MIELSTFELVLVTVTNFICGIVIGLTLEKARRK